MGLGIDGRLDLTSAFDVGPNGSASVMMGRGSLLPCAHARWLFGCAEATFGATVARGVNLASSNSGAAPYAAFGGRAGVDLAMGPRLHLLASLDAVGIATPIIVRVDAGNSPSSIESRPVDVSTGVALFGPIL
jgi:hypothetical protein